MNIRKFFARLFPPLLESVLAAAVGFFVAAVVLAALGFDPILAYGALLTGSIGSVEEISVMLGNATPIILTALAFAVGVRAGIFNIGAEGQVYVGGAAALSVAFLPLPGEVQLAVSVVVAGLAGALWSLPAFALKAYRGVNEVISTIMLNWISYFLILYVAGNLLVGSLGQETTISAPAAMRFPILFGNLHFTTAIFFSMFAAFAFYAYLWRTPSGYEMRAVGLNPEAARFGGISPRKILLYSFALGGVASGGAGAVQVLGRQPPFAMYTDLGNMINMGFNGIGVALIGRNHPIAILASGLFFGALQTGVTNVQLFAHVPFEIVQMIEGIIIIAIAAPEVFRKLVRRKR